MLNRISEIYDLGFEFSFNFNKNIHIEVNYTEALDVMYNTQTGHVCVNSIGNQPLSFATIQSNKPILTFKMEPYDINFNFVKENIESILNEFIKTFLDWYNSHIDSMPDILKNFDDKRILRNIEEKICRYVKLEKLTD